MTSSRSMNIPQYWYNEERDVTETGSAKERGGSLVSVLPESIARVARNVFNMLGSSTDDGGARLNAPIKRAVHTGPALLFKASRTPIPKNTLPSKEFLTQRDILQWLKLGTGLSYGRIATLLGVSRPTIYAWERDEPITDANRRRLLEIYDVLQRAARIYTTPSQLRHWLDMPSGADALSPAQLIAAGEINRARLLAVSAPSSQVVPPPNWIRQAVAPKFRSSSEPMDEPVALDDNNLDAEVGEPRIHWKG
jgi:transcriptional regulator with XRE-family HTH domain